MSSLPALFPVCLIRGDWWRQEMGFPLSPHSHPPTRSSPSWKWLSWLLCPYTATTRGYIRVVPAAHLPIIDIMGHTVLQCPVLPRASSPSARTQFWEIFLSMVRKLLQPVLAFKCRQGLCTLLLLPQNNIGYFPKVELRDYPSNSIKSFNSKHFSPTWTPNPRWSLKPPIQPKWSHSFPGTSQRVASVFSFHWFIHSTSIC